MINAIPEAVELRCEHLENPQGLDETRPRLSWQIADNRPGARQTAYQIVAASRPDILDRKPDLWDSGKVAGDQCLDVLWQGRKLKSRQRVLWRVRVWDHQNAASDWSATSAFEIGLLKPGDWSAQWIGRPLEGKSASQPCPFLRRQFELAKPVAQARLFVTARGLFEVRLNGRRVGRDYFTPGWTDYNKRIQYLVYDVTGQLQPGLNAAGVILADGWYAGYLGWTNNRFVYGEQLSLLFQLEVEYDDGTQAVIASGPEWKTAFGPLLQSDIYNGETCDARREMPGWSAPGFDDAAWQAAVLFPAPKAALAGCRSRPVRRQEELPAQALAEPRFGVHVFDLGQNMVGWARIKVRAPAGRQVTIRYAEMLNTDGTLYTANLRNAKCTDRYICKGDGEETYEPHFTFHGFRYVELTGLIAKPLPTDVTGIVLHSEIPATGTFECSAPLVNRLQQNIRWGQKGNFLEVPTDCPQRDERLGWTGDAQVFARTACFNRDVAAFFTKWCLDLADAQCADGAFPHVAPDILRDGSSCGAAAWADAGVICPWTVYLCYGDKRILERQYSSMTRWVSWRLKRNPDLVSTDPCLIGDWLAIDNPAGECGRSPTPRDLIATAYFARTTKIVAQAAAIIGRRSEARKYAALARRIKAAFNREFVSPNGRLAGDTQTGYLLALGFDLLAGKQQAYALRCLVTDIEERGVHLSTGFVGTPLLAPVLSRFGHTDLAYKLLLQTTYPSWLYTVLQGATTMWERWNSYTREQGFGDVRMNSFNHYGYGAIGEWLYNTVAGIELDPDRPGYKHIIFRPRPGGGLSFARAELLSRYGKIACEWKLDGGKLAVTVTVPPNTSATVFLPGRKPRRIGAGTYEFSARLNSAG